MKKSIVIAFAAVLFFLTIIAGIYLGRLSGGTVIHIDISSADNDTDLGKININTATVEELILLPGVGRSKAQNIIDYRTEYGFYETIDDLKNVTGFSEASVENLRKYITVGG